MSECFTYFSGHFLPQHFWNVKSGLFGLAGDFTEVSSSLSTMDSFIF